MNKLTIAKETCKGCGLCASVCPKNILAISKTVSNDKGYFVVEELDPSKCIGCAFCATMCPDCVIKVEKD
jgi:2-oxoglutarate ferredoxin oxidoreductase subunit delta